MDGFLWGLVQMLDLELSTSDQQIRACYPSFEIIGRTFENSYLNYPDLD